MIDLYLRAGNAGAMASACPFLREEGPDGDRQWITRTPDMILEVIGPIELSPAVYNGMGVQTHVAQIDLRFHINIRCTEAFAELVPESMRCYPATPRRQWA